MRKRVNQKMIVITGVILLITGVVTVFFNIPCSKTKTEFSELIGGLLTKTPDESSVFTEGDIAHLPPAMPVFYMLPVALITGKNTIMRLCKIKKQPFIG